MRTNRNNNGKFVVCLLKNFLVSRSYFFFFLLLVGCASAKKVNTDDPSIIPNLRSHIEYLSSDRLEGRSTGTQGESIAADYIAAAFQKAGLQAKGSEGFFQPFPVAEGREITTATILNINENSLE